MKFQQISLAKLLVWSTLFCGVLTLASVKVFDSLSQSAQNLSRMNGGAEICFSRVSQTFNAAVFATASAGNLQNSFTANTQECFAELQKMAQHPGVVAAINELNSRLYWFHDEIAALLKFSGGEGFQGALNKNRRNSLVDKFQKVEEAKYSVNELLERQIDRNETWLTLGRVSLFVICSLYFLLTGYFLYQRFARIRRLAAIEKKSLSIIMSNEVGREETVHAIAMDAFNVADLSLTKEMYARYRRLYAEKSFLARESHDSEELASLEKPQQQNEHDYKVNLASRLSRVLELHSPNIFTKGAIIDLDCDERLTILSDNPELEMVLENILVDTLCLGVQRLKAKKLVLHSEVRNSALYLNLCITGHHFSELEMAWASGFFADADIDLDLRLIKELITDIGANVLLTNTVTKAGATQAVLSLIFNHYVYQEEAEEKIPENEYDDQKPHKKLINLFSGTKKELISKLQTTPTVAMNEEADKASKIEYKGDGSVI